MKRVTAREERVEKRRVRKKKLMKSRERKKRRRTIRRKNILDALGSKWKKSFRLAVKM